MKVEARIDSLQKAIDLTRASGYPTLPLTVAKADELVAMLREAVENHKPYFDEQSQTWNCRWCQSWDFKHYGAPKHKPDCKAQKFLEG